MNKEILNLVDKYLEENKNKLNNFIFNENEKIFFVIFAHIFLFGDLFIKKYNRN